MNVKYIDIINSLYKIDDELFEEMKSVLLEKYIKFSILSNQDLTKQFMCEKLCDYIEKTELKTGKKFEKLMSYYVNNLSDLVKDFLGSIKIGNDSKGNPVYADSRALKYYNQAMTKRNNKKNPMTGLIDYSRIMFCLYTSIINKKHKIIIDFDYSLSNVKCQTLINSLESELTKEQKFLGRVIAKSEKKFTIKERYCQNEFLFVMIVIMFYLVKDEEVRSEF